MHKTPEFWYVVLLALSAGYYVRKCFQFFNTSADSSLATLFFGYAVFTALICRFLFARWQQRATQPAFSWTSLLLFLLGLLPGIITSLGYAHLRLPNG